MDNEKEKKKQIWLGDQIGSGGQAKVFLLKDHSKKAIKMFKKDYSKSIVLYEALIMSIVEEHKLPVPKIYDVYYREADECMSITMDYIPGKTMNAILLEHPRDMRPVLRKMVKLHIEIHQKICRLPMRLKESLASKIEHTSSLTDFIKKRLISDLKKMPDQEFLCHGDFHGDNIIRSQKSYYIIDWIDATNGCPEADVCRTYILYEPYVPDLAKMYVEIYSEESGVSLDEIYAWLPFVAAARLDENHNKEEANLHAIIKKYYS